MDNTPLPNKGVGYHGGGQVEGRNQRNKRAGCLFLEWTEINHRTRCAQQIVVGAIWSSNNLSNWQSFPIRVRWSSRARARFQTYPAWSDHWRCESWRVSSHIYWSHRL